MCARLFAFVLDLVLVGGVATSLMYSLIAINPVTGLPTNTQRGFDATLAIGIAIALVYVWLSEAFFGTTIAYAFMQATGMVNDHLTTCFRYKGVAKR